MRTIGCSVISRASPKPSTPPKMKPMAMAYSVMPTWARYVPSERSAQNARNTAEGAGNTTPETACDTTYHCSQLTSTTRLTRNHKRSIHG